MTQSSTPSTPKSPSRNFEAILDPTNQKLVAAGLAPVTLDQLNAILNHFQESLANELNLALAQNRLYRSILEENE